MTALNARIQQRNQIEREEDRRAKDIRFRAQGVEKQMQFDAVVAQLRRNEHKLREEERVFLQQQIENAQAEPPHKEGRTSKLLITLGEVIGSVGLTALGFRTILGNPFSGIMDLAEDIFEWGWLLVSVIEVSRYRVDDMAEQYIASHSREGTLEPLLKIDEFWLLSGLNFAAANKHT
jgi:hypothetical protein